MICEFCGRDVSHLRYDPVTWEPIGCIGCMPEMPPTILEPKTAPRSAYDVELQLGFYKAVLGTEGQ